MYELRLKDNSSKVYSVSGTSMGSVIKKMTRFIVKKYGIRGITMTTELSNYQKTCLETLKKMKVETKLHVKNCPCHTCVYIRDIESRPEIRSIIINQIKV